MSELVVNRLNNLAGTSEVLVSDLGEVLGDGGSALVGYLPAGTGAVATTVQAKLQENKTPYDFGCVGDGITDDTVNFQAFLNAVTAGDLAIGSYKIGKVTIPATCKTLRGRGAATVLTAYGTFTAFTPWLFFDGQTDIDVGDFTLNINSTTYATNHAMQFGACTRGTVSNIHMIDGGFIALYAPACRGTVFQNIVVDNFATSLFFADVTPSNLVVDKVRSSKAAAGVGIQIKGGGYHIIRDCYVGGAGSSYFNISLWLANDSLVTGCTVQATTREGIQITDGSRNKILGNTIICGAGHNDFGISVFAQTVDIRDNYVSDNIVYLSGNAGIAMAASPGAFNCLYSFITGNVVVSPYKNPGTPTVASGILLYGGANCTTNIVENNTCFDEANNMVYGVAEWSGGGGDPNNNKLIHNSCFGGAVFVSEGLVVGSLSEVYDLTWNTTTPTPTAFSGSIAGSTAVLKYKRRGRSAEFSIKVVIGTTNTGGGYLIVPSPITIANGCLVGIDGATGKSLTGSSGGTGLIRLYDYAHLYPSTAISVTHQASGTVEI